MASLTVVYPNHTTCMDDRHECQFENCNNHIVHTLYQYCGKHIMHQQPLTHIEKPEECPICFGGEEDNNPYITLTCGHQLHKECMIKCGRPSCPICKQFVYMTPDIFLRLRINNLRWKLDNMDTDVDEEVVMSFKFLFNEFDAILQEDSNDTTYKIMDKILSRFNTVVLDWYY